MDNIMFVTKSGKLETKQRTAAGVLIVVACVGFIFGLISSKS